mgnify:CR=1 FL=1
MARIAGVDIPKNKRGVIALTYIFGLGKSRAIEILEKAGVDALDIDAGCYERIDYIFPTAYLGDAAQPDRIDK